MIYTAIFKSSSIIADYSDDMGDFPHMMKKIFSANKQPIDFYVIPYLSYDYYFLHHDVYTFSAITESNQDNEIILLFLQKLKQNYLQLSIKEKDNLLIKTVTLMRKLMKEYKDKLGENKIKKVENKLEAIMKEKRNQLEATLEKDALINKVREKSDALMTNVTIYINNNIVN